MQRFVHLHVHSQFSLLDGQASVKGLVDKAIQDGMSGIALTDHGAMFGIKEFYDYVEKKNAPLISERKALKKEIQSLEAQEARSAEEEARLTELRSQLVEAEAKPLFKPILGCEVYCARRSRFSKEANVPNPYRPTQSIDNSGWHLVLLAKNLTGYKNLIKMVSRAWIDGYYYRPRIDKELLEQYHEGIIASSACLGGEIPQHIMYGNIEEAERSIEWFKGVFGEDFYLELQRHKTNNPLGNQETYEKQQQVNAILLELGRKHGVKVIATNDIHFLNEEDAEAHDRLICLSTGKDLNDPARMRYSKQEWMKTTAEMNELFADVPEALATTEEICAKVEHYSINHGPLMPDFPIPEEFASADDYLRHLTYEGARRKYGEEGLTDAVRERIDFELSTIANMGFPGYFLIVQDYIKAAREQLGVSVGPGRGSAAGSAVAYCLRITDIDPIKYDLLFERFLNPDRISLPDIDVDFDDDGRGRVLQWVTDKYGAEKVAHIITYGTMATKLAIKDVARVLQLPLSESNRLCKLIPDKLPAGPDGKVPKMNLPNAIKAIPELREAEASHDPLMRNTIRYAKMLEGNVRNTGVHACGFIICRDDISDWVPVSTADDKETGEKLHCTQYEGKVIEETGLIKMDFLGLKTLSILREAVENIRHSLGIEIDVDALDIEDPATYDLYCDGRTVGTFQFESPGMQKYLRELHPSTFEDLIAMNALYRPGPMEYIPQFIKRKHGEEPITYDLPCMEKYLKDTYGITVYQEQVMLLSREIADFTRGESDNLRKAMGKKLIDKLNHMYPKFVAGGNAHGYDPAVLEKIWKDWTAFASYAFNKSHATCYSWVAYQTAYLKANFPAQYMAAVMSRSIGNIADLTKFLDECKAMRLVCLGPDVNESYRKFSVNHLGDIRFGLGGIKGLGDNAVQAIIDERERGGKFTSVFDFFERVNLNICNRKNLECLALSGAFDSFGEMRREQFFGQSESGLPYLDALLTYGQRFQMENEESTNSLFGDSEAVEISKPHPPTTFERWSDLEKLNRERELIGIYISGHPLDDYAIVLNNLCTIGMPAVADLTPFINQEITFGGIVTAAEERISKRGSAFGKIRIEDFKGGGEFLVFGDTWAQFKGYLAVGNSVFITAGVQPPRWGKGDPDLAIKKVEWLADVKDRKIQSITINARLEEIDVSLVTEILELVRNAVGESALQFNIYDASSAQKVTLSSRNSRIDVTHELIRYIEAHPALSYSIN